MLPPPLLPPLLPPPLLLFAALTLAEPLAAGATEVDDGEAEELELPAFWFPEPCPTLCDRKGPAETCNAGRRTRANDKAVENFMVIVYTEKRLPEAESRECED